MEVAVASVLVVEDEPDLQFLWRSILQRAGYEVLEARAGREALDMARAEAPDLILLDGHLPDVSGWELLTTLSADPALSRIPVVMVTGEKSQEAEAHGYRAGAVAYLTKPVGIDELTRAVRDALS